MKNLLKILIIAAFFGGFVLADQRAGQNFKIAIIGASGKAGSLITKEAAAKNLNTTAIVRNAKKMEGAMKKRGVDAKKVRVVEKDLFALNAADLDGFDAVVSAFGEFENLELHAKAIRHLCELLKNRATKLYVVGGAGSLYVDAAKTTRLLDTKAFPAAFRPLALAQAEVLYYLQSRGDVNWVFVSPPADFRADGARSGRYKIGGDVLSSTSVGSYADYALAIVEIAISNKFNKQRISISD